MSDEIPLPSGVNTQTSAAQTIVRIQKRQTPFVQIDRTVAEDPRLSWRSKGLMLYLLSRPDDWQVFMSDLEKRATDGRGSVKRALRQLAFYGYASLRTIRGKGGRVAGKTWAIFERPHPEGSGLDEAGNLLMPSDATDSTENRRSVKPTDGESPPTKKDSKKEEREEALTVPIPLLLQTPEFHKAWEDWVADRRRRRKPITRRAAELQLKDLEAMGPVAAIESIRKSITSGWTGLFAPNASKGSRQITSSREFEDQYRDGEPAFGRRTTA